MDILLTGYIFYYDYVTVDRKTKGFQRSKVKFLSYSGQLNN